MLRNKKSTEQKKLIPASLKYQYDNAKKEQLSAEISKSNKAICDANLLILRMNEALDSLGLTACKICFLDKNGVLVISKLDAEFSDV